MLPRSILKVISHASLSKLLKLGERHKITLRWFLVARSVLSRDGTTKEDSDRLKDEKDA